MRTGSPGARRNITKLTQVMAIMVIKAETALLMMKLTNPLLAI
jgi:hypothetical protein